MTDSDLSILAKFYLDVTEKYVRITDNTDYSGLSINTDYVYTNFYITTPPALSYYNDSFTSNADIVGSTGTMYKDFILPLTGVYVYPGTYTIVMTVQIIDGVSVISEYTKTFTYTYSFTEPVLDLSFTIDCYNSTFKVEDNTTYIASGYSALTTLRQIETTPPSGSGMSVDTDTSSDTTTPLYNNYSANIYAGEYSTVLTSTLTYTMDDGLIIYFSDSITDTDIGYNIDMDSLKDLIYSYITSYYTSLENNGFDSLEIDNNLLKISSSLSHYSVSLDYQDLSDAYNSALRIYKILVDTSSVTVEEIIPFENSYSFTNTDEKVKMTSGGTANYLSDLVDGTTIENNGGVLSVVGSLTDYVSKASGGTFGGAITVTGVVTATGGTSTEWNTAYTHSQLTSGNPHSVSASDLSLVIGTDVLAYDAGLNNLAGITMSADKFYYTTADNTHAAATVTSFARSILDDADEATFKATVNLEIGVDVLAYQEIGIADNNLLEVDGTPVSGEYAVFTSSGITSISNATLISNIESSISHNSLASLDSGTTYLHLTSAQKTIATQAASSSQSGYLTAVNFNTFSGKQDTISAGTGITVSSNIISSKNSEIDHDSLLNYDVVQHRIINDSGTSLTELWSASKINGLIGGNTSIYVITMDAGGGVLISRTITSPSGWTVDDSATVSYGNGLGSLNTSLTIQHNKGKHGTVLVMLDDGNVYTQAEGSLAFSTFKESSDLNAMELVMFCQEISALEVVVII